jgi:hypothetical protein
MIVSEGKVYGARYHCVEPVEGNWKDMESWCRAIYGAPGEHIWGYNSAPIPLERWYMNARKFWFRDERDRTMFMLRWIEA